MKARILEFNIGRFTQMNVQCVLGCMKMIQILRNGYNVQMKIVMCGRSHAECLEMCENAYVCIAVFVKHCFYEHMLVTAIAVAI